MSPYVFKYKSIAVSWFMALTIISIVLGYIIIRSRSQEKGKQNKIEDIYLILIALGFIGARLTYVLLKFEAYRYNLSYVVKLTHFNLSLAGGVFFSLLGLLIISKLQKMSFYDLLEIYIVPFYLSMSIGIWSMFFDGMLIGREYNGFLALDYLGKSRHMVVLYLSSLFILATILQLTILKRIKSKYRTPLLLIIILGCYYLIKIYFTN